jgi:Ca-activated chloride channel family protein
VLVTDGYIGFEAQVLAAARAKLPRGSRVHTLGVGSAVNRALTQPLARLGGGVEVIVGLGEDPERAARRLVERTSAPLFVDVSVEGSAVVGTASRRLPDLFAHAPALIPAELRPEGGEIVVTGRIAGGERFVHRSQVARFDGSAALAALWARERVADLDADERQDEEIERLGVTFQIATRKTAFVAVSRERTVSGDERTTVRLPHELPYGMSIEGLGLRAGGWGVTTTGRMTRVGGVVDARTMVAADSGIPVMGPSAAPQMAEPAEPPLVPKRGWLPTFFVLLLIAFVIALLAVLLWP